MSVPERYEKEPLVEPTSAPQPLDNGRQDATNEQMLRLERTDRALKRHVRILRFLSRLLSAILSAFMFSAMAYALDSYYKTRNETIKGGAHPWATNTVLWPTYMLLATAGVSFVINSITLCFYCCGVRAANKADNSMSYFSYLIIAVHAIVWAITMGLFKMAFTGNDLWGWSCSSSADAIQPQVISSLNFNNLCMIQTGTWIVSIIQVIAYITLFFTYVAIGWRFVHKKRMLKMQQQMGFSHIY